MSRTDEKLDRLLDRAVERIRGEEPDPRVIEQASQRAWERVRRELQAADAVDAIRGCEDYQRLIPELLAGRLPDARALLVRDHSRECVACRKALTQARTGARAATSAVSAQRRSTWRSPVRWALAAGLLLAAALFALQLGPGLVESGAPLQVATVEGALFQVTEAGPVAVEAGARFEHGERLRTAKGSGTIIELADGSRLEMAPRSEVRVLRRWRGSRVDLTRGSIIVEAADQGSGHLFVRTEDCLVSVQGTVFSVVHGTRGSRVSVLEGEVHVDHGQRRDVLLAGDQVSTRDVLGPVPIEQEIAWSRNVDRHLALLRELQAFRKELSERLPTPELRHSTRLLDAASPDTVIYIGFPNLTDTLSQAHELLQEKVQQTGVLQDWWQEHMVASGAEPLLAEAVQRIRAFGNQLGDELAITLQQPAGADQEMIGPVFLAELRDPAGFRTLLETESRRLAETAGQTVLAAVDDPFAVAPPGELLFWADGELLVAATEIEHLRAMASWRGSGDFAETPFRRSLAEVYRSGTNIVFGVDIERLLLNNVSASDDQALQAMGFDNVQHLVLSRRQEGDASVTQAALSFEGERRGLASWLAEPSPMGALEFVSADAHAVAAFVVRTPASLLSELFDRIGAIDEDFDRELAEVEAELNLDLVDDVVGPLGGEVVLALDGPVLPVPAWKLVLEVYDQNRLQRTIEWAVERLNQEAAQSGVDVTATLIREEIGGRTYWALGLPEAKGQIGTQLFEGTPGVHYTFADGYLIAAPQRQLLDRALQHREAGYTLVESSRFKALLPREAQANFSALVFQNLGDLLRPLMNSQLARTAPLTDEQRQVVGQMVDEAEPSLYYAYGERDRIVLGGWDRAGWLGADMSNLFSVGAVLSHLEGTHAARRSYHDPEDR